MAEQLDLFPEDPTPQKMVDLEKADKARARAAENAEYADKRTPRSPLIAEAELAKMKEILAKPRAEKPEQARMKYGNPALESYVARGSGAGGGAGGIELEGKMNRNVKPKMKAGGKVSSASKRADGCAQRGKTRGKYL